MQKYSTLSYVKDTIKSKLYIYTIDDNPLLEIKEDKVINLYKVQRKEQGQYVKPGTSILTFDGCNLPRYVKIGWNIYKVKEYIP